jgi:hypothetical protein
MIQKLIVTIICFSIIGALNAQQPVSANAQQVAQNIATKMKDSLNLTVQQKNQLYNINIQLHTQKQGARTQHTGNMPQLTQAIQAIEKKRDSLYQPILTVPQFNLYKTKKRNLIAN